MRAPVSKDEADVALAREQIAHDMGDEMRDLRVEHRRLHVEVVVARRAGHEGEAAFEQRFLLDDLEQPRFLLRGRGGWRRRAGEARSLARAVLLLARRRLES